MAVLVALVVATLVGCGLGWTTHLIRVGLLDARDLVEKTAFGRPRSAMQWPELRLETVVVLPDEDMVLTEAVWPAHPSNASLLLLRVTDAAGKRRLVKWSASHASITTSTATDSWVELRRRRTVDRVRAEVVSEAPR